MRFLTLFLLMFLAVATFLFYSIVTGQEERLEKPETLRIVQNVQYTPEPTPQGLAVEENFQGVRKEVRREDLKTFFIGVTGYEDELKLITMDIDVNRGIPDSLENTIEFYYVLNTKRFREEGYGIVFTDIDSVAFIEKTTGKTVFGKLYREGEELVFESNHQDSNLTWKMKEK